MQPESDLESDDEVFDLQHQAASQHSEEEDSSSCSSADSISDDYEDLNISSDDASSDDLLEPVSPANIVATKRRPAQ